MCGTRYLILGLEPDVLAFGTYPAVLRVTLGGGASLRKQAPKHLSAGFQVSWRKAAQWWEIRQEGTKSQ